MKRLTPTPGLDNERSWIILDEINDFLWPGYDLRAIPGSDPARMDYGVLPLRFFDAARTAFLALAQARRVSRTPLPTGLRPRASSAPARSRARLLVR